MDNRAANITIFYSSIVHSGDVDYMRDASPPHTRNLINLVADTEYTITVTAKYSDNTTAIGTVTTNTKPGNTSNRGIYIDMVYYIHRFNPMTYSIYCTSVHISKPHVNNSTNRTVNIDILTSSV